MGIGCDLVCKAIRVAWFKRHDSAMSFSHGQIKAVNNTSGNGHCDDTTNL